MQKLSNNIYFTYNGCHGDIFTNFSLSIEQPGLYCIIGESGIGKSTLFELLLGFYEVDKGSIYINEVDIKNYSLKDLRNIIGIVHQEIFLMNDTVMNNIKFGNNSISDDIIIELAKSLGFHKYLNKLKNGYYIAVEEMGKNISLGQKRMITILRVLCRDPKIILFDEITSNIDSFTQQLIHQFLKKLSEEKICLFITHKDSDLAYADKVINLESSRITLHAGNNF